MLDINKWLEQQENPLTGEALKAEVVEMLRTIRDPEIPVNIYDLGLIYALDIDSGGNVNIKMTLTAPNCPVAQTFPDTVREAVLCISGVGEVKLELVWEPPWSRDCMSEAARLQLGML